MPVSPWGAQRIYPTERLETLPLVRRQQKTFVIVAVSCGPLLHLEASDG